MSRFDSDDIIATAFIIGMVVLAIVSTVSMAISETVQKISCFENGGSWKNSTCTIDKEK